MWEGGRRRRSGGRSGAALKTKTPHVNVGNKFKDLMWLKARFAPSTQVNGSRPVAIAACVTFEDI